MQLTHLLLVEDDRSIAEALVQALQGDHQVTTTGSGGVALRKRETESFDAIILDLNLPDLPGLKVCQQLGARGIITPVLILTADDQVLSKVHLLDAGANDYLIKPFSLGELKARLRVLLRPPKLPTPVSSLVVGDLELNRQTHIVRREGRVIALRPKEFALLEYLMEHPNELATRRALTRYAWPERHSIWTNTVDVHIKHLRDKVDRPFRQQLIQTIHGLGYKLEVPTNGN